MPCGKLDTGVASPHYVYACVCSGGISGQNSYHTGHMYMVFLQCACAGGSPDGHAGGILYCRMGRESAYQLLEPTDGGAGRL